MTKLFTRLRARSCAPDERGVALVTVMLATFALLTLATATVEMGVGSQNLSRHDQDWNAALASAEAGIDDYIFRLNENSSYWTYSATVPPPDGNQAFTQYVSIAGSANPGLFRYTADTSTIAVDGAIKLTSTGKVRNAKRSVTAALRRRSFLDYLYFTDYETLDPALYTGNPYTPAQAQVACAKYWYAGRSSTNPACSEITFISVDNINGPLHTNDALRVCGTPHFNGNTSTSWNTSPPRYRDCGGSAPVFATSGDPKYVTPLTMPPSNSAIKTETDAGKGGCLYTGPTSIVLNNDGTMTVSSPFSKNTNNGCPANTSPGPGYAAPVTGPMPSNGVIYVQGVPSVVTDPNYTNGCPYSVRYQNNAANPLRSHPQGYPIANDITTYQCRAGDVFVEGRLKGQLTIAAESDINITWRLQYNGGVSGSDLLGLVANNNVNIYHPVKSCSSGGSCVNGGQNLNAHGGGTPFSSPTIQAANLSLSHSLRVQQWNKGVPLGTINLTGTISQRYRGPVGTFSGGSPPVIVTGYAKGYIYDQRLKYLSPPKFLDPVASAWAIATWAEVHSPAGT